MTHERSRPGPTRTGYPASDEHPTSTRSSTVDLDPRTPDTFPQVIALNEQATVDVVAGVEMIKSLQLYR